MIVSVLRSGHGVCSGIGGRQQILTGKEETKSKEETKNKDLEN
jgi:hypothetical protein